MTSRRRDRRRDPARKGGRDAGVTGPRARPPTPHSLIARTLSFAIALHRSAASLASTVSDASDPVGGRDAGVTGPGARPPFRTTPS